MNYSKDVARHYKRAQIETANPGELVILLYDGALDFLNRAEQAFQLETPDRIELFHNWLVRAQNIITELMVSLDMEKGGEIAQNLFKLYEFMNHQLVECNMKKDLKPLKDVRQLLETLRVAWVDIKDKIPDEMKQKERPPSSLNLQG